MSDADMDGRTDGKAPDIHNPTNTKSSNMQWECSICGRKGHNHNSPNCPALKQ